MNTYLRKIKKNSKALSPVVASIILIAVTVAVSVVVAAWMGGMSLGLMNNTENVKISYAQFSDANNVVLTVQNNGANTVTINPTGTIDGNTIAVAGHGTNSDLYTVTKGGTEQFTITIQTQQNQQSLSMVHNITYS